MPTEITQESFAKLLSWFHADPEQAGVRYEKIRGKLIKLFEFRGAISPNDLADEVINRVAKKIAEGLEVQASDPYVYFYGVAQNVLREDWKTLEREIGDPERLQPAKQPTTNREEVEQETERIQLLEQRHRCLDSCLETLSGENRELLLQYYQGETTVKIQNRERLAAKLGLSANALRIRAHRIREKIETCVTNCLKSWAGGKK